LSQAVSLLCFIVASHTCTFFRHAAILAYKVLIDQWILLMRLTKTQIDNKTLLQTLVRLSPVRSGMNSSEMPAMYAISKKE
jgi:hypothetical protein